MESSIKASIVSGRSSCSRRCLAEMYDAMAATLACERAGRERRGAVKLWLVYDEVGGDKQGKLEQ